MKYFRKLNLVAYLNDYLLQLILDLKIKSIFSSKFNLFNRNIIQLLIEFHSIISRICSTKSETSNKSKYVSIEAKGRHKLIQNR